MMRKRHILPFSFISLILLLLLTHTLVTAGTIYPVTEPKETTIPAMLSLPPPYMVKNINSAAVNNGDSFPGPFSRLGGSGNQILFRAWDAAVGSEPRISDGTESGTRLLKDVSPGPDSSSYWTDTRFLQPVTLADGRFFFVTDDGTYDTEIRTSDGSEAGTMAVAKVCAGSVDHLVATANAAFFTAGIKDETGGCASPGWLWRSDGTIGGTEPLVYEYEITGMWAANGILFYLNYDYELWVLGETSAIPQRIAEYVYYDPAAAGDALYFYRMAPGESGYLWISDGSSPGTTQLKELDGAITMFPAGDLLYFVDSKSDGVSSLWLTDGTAAGTSLVKDGWNNENRISELAAVGNTAFFSVLKTGDLCDLWQTDGSSSGTALVKSFPTVEGGPNLLTAFDEWLVFTADDGVHGRELWVSDGTEEGTVMHADINPAAGEDSQLHNLAARNKTLYFAADDGLHGIELWALSLDGTSNYRLFLPGILATK